MLQTDDEPTTIGVISPDSGVLSKEPNNAGLVYDNQYDNFGCWSYSEDDDNNKEPQPQRSSSRPVRRNSLSYDPLLNVDEQEYRAWNLVEEEEEQQQQINEPSNNEPSLWLGTEQEETFKKNIKLIVTHKKRDGKLKVQVIWENFNEDHRPMWEDIWFVKEKFPEALTQYLFDLKEKHYNSWLSLCQKNQSLGALMMKK